MVMKVEPLAQAVTELRAQGAARVVVLTPQGQPWKQGLARAWAAEQKPTVLVCGRYAGIDHRFTVEHADMEISLGDFVLNGGEVAACAIIESVVRLLPNALGNRVSAELDSFGADGLLECPQFTRPREVGGLPVPSPLLSGNHAQIRAFEDAVARVRTAVLRPDLPVTGLVQAVKIVSELNAQELRALGLNNTDLEKLS